MMMMTVVERARTMLVLPGVAVGNGLVGEGEMVAVGEGDAPREIVAEGVAVEEGDTLTEGAATLPPAVGLYTSLGPQTIAGSGQVTYPL